MSAKFTKGRVVTHTICGCTYFHWCGELGSVKDNCETTEFVPIEMGDMPCSRCRGVGGSKPPYHLLSQDEKDAIEIVIHGRPPRRSAPQTIASQGLGGSATVDQGGYVGEGSGQTGALGQQPSMGYGEDLMREQEVWIPFASRTTSYGQQQSGYGQQHSGYGQQQDTTPQPSLTQQPSRTPSPSPLVASNRRRGKTRAEVEALRVETNEVDGDRQRIKEEMKNARKDQEREKNEARRSSYGPDQMAELQEKHNKEDESRRNAAAAAQIRYDKLKQTVKAWERYQPR